MEHASSVASSVVDVIVVDADNAGVAVAAAAEGEEVEAALVLLHCFPHTILFRCWFVVCVEVYGYLPLSCWNISKTVMGVGMGWERGPSTN